MFFRIAVFSVTVFYDERVVIVAEQRPDAGEEDSFQWMSRVLQVKHLSNVFFFQHHLCFSDHLECFLNIIFLFFSCSITFRPLIASTRSASTVWLWYQPTLYPKLPSVASTSLTPSSSSWTAACTLATSSCVLTRVSLTYPNLGRNSQVHVR